MQRIDKKSVELRDPRYRIAINAFLLGRDKQAAAEEAGFSRQSAKDIFAREDVQAEIDRRLRMAEDKTDKNLEWICQQLEKIITAEEPIEFDRHGRANLNFNLLSNGVKDLLGKIVITESRTKAKYGGKHSEVKYANVSAQDKINALKELSILRGYREEKQKIDVNDRLVDLVNKRRQELANEQGSLPEDNGDVA